MDFQTFLAHEVGDGNPEDFKSSKMFKSYRLKIQSFPYLGLQHS